jgi:hypothetical protein
VGLIPGPSPSPVPIPIGAPGQHITGHIRRPGHIASPPRRQVTFIPPGGPQTGGGSTAGSRDGGLFAFGGSLLGAAAGMFVMRRRATRHG